MDRVNQRILFNSVTILVAIVLAVNFVSADALIKTVPNETKWLADGTTQYKVKVLADNTGLGGNKTRGTDFRFENTPNFDFVSGSNIKPTTNDFFEGFTMLSFANFVSQPGVLSSRATEDPNAGPANKSGFVGEYNFTVPVGTAPGVYYFNLGDLTAFYDGGDNSQPLTITHENFTVLSATLPNDTDKFYVKDASNNVVAWFGSGGNIALKGTCYVSADCAMGAGNALTIATNSDEAVAFIDNSGNLCVQSGDCLGFASSCSSTTGLIVKNSTDTQVSSLSDNGVLCALGGVYENQSL